MALAPAEKLEKPGHLLVFLAVRRNFRFWVRPLADPRGSGSKGAFGAAGTGPQEQDQRSHEDKAQGD
jgi:hypothetical protein